jgi:hypothetical protein
MSFKHFVCEDRKCHVRIVCFTILFNDLVPGNIRQWSRSGADSSERKVDLSSGRLRVRVKKYEEQVRSTPAATGQYKLEASEYGKPRRLSRLLDAGSSLMGRARSVAVVFF